MRHKYITRYDPDEWQTFFTGLKQKGYVVSEYKYVINTSTKNNTFVGAVLAVVNNGEKFVSIASNMGEREKSHSYGRKVSHKTGKITYGRKTKHTHSRIMYRLTEEGARYIKGLIVEERI